MSEPETLTPQEIAAWLGLEPGGRLVCEPADQPAIETGKTLGNWLLGGSMLAFVGLPMVSIGLGLGKLVAVASMLLGFVVLFYGVWLVDRADKRMRGRPWLKLGDPSLVADGFGLTASYPRARERRLPWTAIKGLEPAYGEVGADGARRVERWVIEVDEGDPVTLRADAAEAPGLLAAVRGVLAARQHGRALWDPASVPEASLSRLEGEAEMLGGASISRAE